MQPDQRSNDTESTDAGERIRDDRHLRLTLEIDRAANVRVSQTRVVKQPLVATRRVVGPFVYEVIGGDEQLRVETMPDPFEERGFGGPEQGGHSLRRAQSALVVVRVPLSSAVVPQDLQVNFYRARARLPSRKAELASLLAGGTRSVATAGKIDIRDLRALPQWETTLRDGGLRDPGNRSGQPD